MSIQSEIDRINNNVQTTLNTIAATGVGVGTNSDALPAAAAALANTKQDKLTGSEGQIVIFDANGNPVAGDFEGGGAKIQTGSYDGTGTKGSSNPVSLTFDFVPKYFQVINKSQTFVDTSSSGFTWIGQQGGTGSSSVPKITLSGQTLSWYASSAGYQCNNSGVTYYWIALG